MATKEERLSYGFSTEFLNANPDIKSLVDEAIDEGWTMPRFTDELRSSSWWKNKSDAQRRYDLMKVENEGELERNLQDARNAVRRMAMRLGVALDGGQVAAIARNWVRNDLQEDAVRSIIGRKYTARRRPGVYDRENLGIAGRARQTFSEMARQYGFVLSGKRAAEFAMQVARGVRTVEDYEGYFRERAVDLFPSIANDIREGRTVRDVLEPYLNIAAQELGINPATMNTTAAKWLRPLQYTPKGGEGRRMTNEEWVKELRSNRRYGYDRSNNAQKVAAEFATELGRAFGRF